jgi:hypothetical protein
MQATETKALDPAYRPTGYGTPGQAVALFATALSPYRLLLIACNRDI